MKSPVLLRASELSAFIDVSLPVSNSAVLPAPPYQRNLPHCEVDFISQSLSLPSFEVKSVSPPCFLSACLVSLLALRFYCQPQLSSCQRDYYMNPG